MPNITRRDFLNGVALVAGAALMPTGGAAQAESASAYPPAMTGLRGSHPGAYETAHDLAWAGQREFGALAGPPEDYDLIVIGAGISGLSAAHFYREQVKADARILILDNHDDFGGHARRNEFKLPGGETLLTYGGTQSFDSPEDYSAVAAGLLKDMGIDLDRLAQSYDLTFFQRHGLTMGIYYDAASFGRAALVASGRPTRRKASYYARYWVPGLAAAPEFFDTLDQTPLSEAQRQALTLLVKNAPKTLARFKGDEGESRFYGENYVRFLREAHGIKDEAVLKLLSMPMAEEAALGGVGVSLPLALEGEFLGLPDGGALARLLEDEDLEPDPAEDGEDDTADAGDAYVHHFPDGNATLARLLVARLIPAVAKVASPEDCVTAQFDYGRLDQPDQPVRLRLSALAVEAGNRDGGSTVRYVRGGKLHEAQARHTVMAGWHMLAAHIIPDLDAAQKEAMRANIKMPLVYAQVVVRNWQAIKASTVAAAYCPTSYFQFVQMDYPVAMGGYAPKRDPESPVVLLMIRMPCPPLDEAPVPDLLRQGRYEVLGTDFATYEEQIKQQLGGMYGGHGFDAARDIVAITVNRWGHGYVYEDAEYKGEPAHVAASRRHGHIVMANADATGSAYTDAAIDAAMEAVLALKEEG